MPLRRSDDDVEWIKTEGKKANNKNQAVWTKARDDEDTEDEDDFRMNFDDDDDNEQDNGINADVYNYEHE